jgi:hypothetical protein
MMKGFANPSANRIEAAGIGDKETERLRDEETRIKGEKENGREIQSKYCSGYTRID